MSTGPSRENGPFIWATRGRTWGFRFLRAGGLDDPLSAYEEAFSSVGDQPEIWRRVGDTTVLRFLDPEGRRDAAGRVIPQEFVLVGAWADDIDSLDTGRERLWGEVAEYYHSVWDESAPPPPPP